jgi:RNA-directed DNA polymerase
MRGFQALCKSAHQWPELGGTVGYIPATGLCVIGTAMKHEWFKRRGYKHFDSSVGERFANGEASNPRFVETHNWLPLIHYVKREKRYKPLDGKTVYKSRDIMYASHRDACIISRYAHVLSRRLDDYYEQNCLGGHIIAYRRLGKSNYDFSSEAFRFSVINSPCVVMCFDITGFFDHLDHGILKDRLKRVLVVRELSEDWYKVFRQVTRFKKIDRADLKAHPVFGPRLKLRTRAPIASISKVKTAGIPIYQNPHRYGVPQGTPISSVLSNLYMIDVDRTMSEMCVARQALYQRYSDDILIVCRHEDEADIKSELFSIISTHRLKIKEEKTERVEFDEAHPAAFQYLGFNISPDGATIRPNSLGRQWRKAKRSIRRAKRDGEAAINAGKASKIYTKKLRKKLSPVAVRNFSSYARKASQAFGSEKIMKQVLRLERMADQAIRELNT